jgi:hypothetical protein
MPDVFTFGKLDVYGNVGTSGEYGYIRIWTFDVVAPNVFVDEFIRIAKLLPAKGLIIDVRGNGGGHILAGEYLLQVLSAIPISGERFQFINTPSTLQICQKTTLGGLDRWRDSIERSVETGEIYSQGFTLDQREERYNRIGRQYDGPVALVVDALCYSTTDIFAAGFQDHGLGLLLGCDTRTGAGGANVWTHQVLRQLFGNGLVPGESSPFEAKLPGNASFRIAVRRSTRVGAKMGDPLEGMGVAMVNPETDVYRMTREDVLGENEGLLAWALQRLVQYETDTTGPK